MSAGFTPGPWTTKPGLFWICDVGNNIDDPGVWSTAIPADGEPFPFGSKQADANLIAAAPDLYAALVGMLRVCPSERNGMRLAEYDAARAALRKAQGLAEASGDTDE